MQYFNHKSLLYSDTLVPDIFISEYLPALKSEYVKIYIYCLFLAGKNRTPSVQDLARTLDIPADTVKSGLLFMANLSILSWTEEGVVLKDLKEMEIARYYRPKSTSTPAEAAERGRLNIRRNQVIEAINSTFFDGVMSPSWYGDIDMWFERYGFEEDVMLMLFHHCMGYGGLKKNYIAKVAESWHAKGIVNSFDVDRYLAGYEAMKTVSKQIQKKLRRRTFDEFHEELVDKWVNKLGFSYEMIECALELTVGNEGTNFRFFDKVLTDWHDRGLDSVGKIREALRLFDEERARTRGAGSGRGRRTAGAAGSGTGAGMAGGAAGRGGRTYRQGDFGQREYDHAAFDRFVSSDFGGGAGGGAGDDMEEISDGASEADADMADADAGAGVGAGAVSGGGARA